MSYTAPDYVDTKSQAILALASVIADEDKTALGDGSVNRALDVLADVLAESDVQVPQTNAGAILALAQYASGMLKPEGTINITENGEGIDVSQYATADVSVSGGGGVTLGTISGVVADDITVAVGDEFNGGAAILEIAVDNQTVTDSTDQLNVGRLSRCAAGASVDAVYHSVSEEDTIHSVVFRWCTIDIEEYKYSSISEPINLAATTSTRTFETPFGTETWNVATFIMPEPPTEGAYLLLSSSPSLD